MNQIKYAELQPDERIKKLEETCAKIERITYTRPFTQEQLDDARDKLSEAVDRLSFVEEEKKAVNKEYSDEITAIRMVMTKQNRILRNKVENITENTYKFIDRINNEVGYYDSKGNLVKLRGLTDEESQMTINEAIENSPVESEKYNESPDGESTNYEDYD